MNTQVAILGFGKEGQAMANYFAYKKNYGVIVLDEKLDELPMGFEAFDFQKSLDIPAVDLVVKSPGIALSKVINPNNIPVTSLITMLFQKLDMSKVIAVTGTKGKSSTTSLIHHSLISNGYKAELLGNIGNINMEILDSPDPETYYIFELSSFQCQLLQNSPHIAIWTSYYPDHQDVHADMDEYYNAKAQICKFQNKNDIMLVGPKVPVLFKTEGQILTGKAERTFEIALTGEHNQNNAQLAFMALSNLGLKEKQILESFKSYTPLKGRLENIGEYKEIKFFADDQATIPEATWAAINSFDPTELDTIIVGGYDKGLDYTQLATNLLSTKIKNYICFEPVATQIVKELDRTKVNIMTAKNMFKAVELAYKLTKKDGICLLSPGAASFGMFLNAYDRGEQYRKYVEELGVKEPKKEVLSIKKTSKKKRSR